MTTKHFVVTTSEGLQFNIPGAPIFDSYVDYYYEIDSINESTLDKQEYKLGLLEDLDAIAEDLIDWLENNMSYGELYDALDDDTKNRLKMIYNKLDEQETMVELFSTIMLNYVYEITLEEAF